MKKAARILLVLAIVGAFGAGAVWMWPVMAERLAASETPAPAAAAVAVPESTASAINVVTVRRAEITDRVLGSGTVVPQERVSVQPQVEGFAVESLSADVGDLVEAGQVLATLSTSSVELTLSQLQASRAAAEAALAQAEAQLLDAEATRDEAVRVRDRTLALSEQGALSGAAAQTAESTAASARARVSVAQSGLVAARSQLEVADAQIADARLQLSRTKVKAPYGGIVEDRNATLGSIATAAGEPMFVIVRDGLLELRVDVSEQDLLRVDDGQPVAISSIGVDRPLQGTVTLVEPRVDEATRLGRVRIAVAEPDAVRSGMFADAQIVVAQRDALTLPISAIGRDGDGTFVYKVDGTTVRRVAVTTGIIDVGRVEVLGDALDAGDMVVRRSGAFVRDGETINPVMADDDASPNGQTAAVTLTE